MLERLLLALDRHPRISQAVLAALLVAAVASLPKLRIDDSPERWLPEDTREAWRVLDEHFNFGDTVAVGFEFARPIRDDDTAPLRQFREQLAAIDGMRQVYDASLLAEEIEGVPLTELIDPKNFDRFGLYEGALWSRPKAGATNQTLLMACELAYPRDTKEHLHDVRNHVIQQVYKLIEDARKRPEFQDVTFHVAGGILLMDELERQARFIALVFLPLSILVGVGSLLLGFRSLRALVLSIGGSLAAMILVLGGVALSGTGWGALTMSAPTLISIIAIATTVHFASFAADHGDLGSTPSGRAQLVQWVAVPCLGASLTTGVGFLMLAFNQLSPVRSLGVELFAGSIAAFFCVFIISQVLPIRRAYAGRLLRPERFGHWSDLLGRAPTAITVGLLLLMAVFMLLAWPWSPTSPVGLKVDVDPFSFFGPQNHLVQSRQHFLDRGFGLYQLEVVLIPREQGTEVPGGDANSSPESKNQRLAQDYSDLVTQRTDLGVLRVISTQAVRDRQNKFYEDLRKLRDEQGTLAVGLKLLQLAKLTKHLSTFTDTFKNWSRDKLNQGAIRLTFLADDRAGDGFASLLAFAEQNMPPQFDGFVAGTIASVVQLANGLVSGIAIGLAVSAVVMGVVCTILFRSVRLAAIAFLPNVFPIIMVYGFMGAVGLPISSGSAMVATVSLGIALNDTIHFILHYRKLTREEGCDIGSALRATFVHIGRPIVLTSVVFMLGFLIFLASDFLPLYHFGLLGSIAMVGALLGDIVMLPCLLRTFDRPPNASANTAH